MGKSRLLGPPFRTAAPHHQLATGSLPHASQAGTAVDQVSLPRATGAGWLPMPSSIPAVTRRGWRGSPRGSWRGP